MQRVVQLLHQGVRWSEWYPDFELSVSTMRKRVARAVKKRTDREVRVRAREMIPMIRNDKWQRYHYSNSSESLLILNENFTSFQVWSYYKKVADSHREECNSNRKRQRSHGVDHIIMDEKEIEDEVGWRGDYSHCNGSLQRTRKVRAPTGSANKEHDPAAVAVGLLLKEQMQQASTAATNGHYKLDGRGRGEDLISPLPSKLSSSSIATSSPWLPSFTPTAQVTSFVWPKHPLACKESATVAPAHAPITAPRRLPIIDADTFRRFSILKVSNWVEAVTGNKQVWSWGVQIFVGSLISQCSRLFSDGVRAFWIRDRKNEKKSNSLFQLAKSFAKERIDGKVMLRLNYKVRRPHVPMQIFFEGPAGWLQSHAWNDKEYRISSWMYQEDPK